MEPTAIINVVGEPHGYTIIARSANKPQYHVDLLRTFMPFHIQYKVVKQLRVDNGVAYTLELYGHCGPIRMLCAQFGWRVRWL